MDFTKKNAICRLCLKKLTKNCEPIEEITRNTLNYLTLFPNLTISDDPMMCETCAGNLTKCFDFKTRCLSTEDCIASFAEGEYKKVDLRDIFSKIKLNGNIDRVPDDHSVCRLCLELVTSVSIRHDMDLIKLLQKYFLELDLNITDDILACTPCYNSLRFYAGFLNTFMNIETRIDEYSQVEGWNYKGQVDLIDVATFIPKSVVKVENMSSLIIKEEKLENVVDTNVDVKVKCEDLMDVEDEQQENSNSFQHHTSPSQSDGEPSTATARSAQFTCKICGYQNNCRDRLQEHILAHKSIVLEESYNCEVCSYKTRNKSTLRKHKLRYKHRKIDLNPDVVTQDTSLKCNLCDYEANWRSNLKKHMITHKTPSEIPMYKCETCTYETRHKYYLRQHMLVHMDESKINMYQCEVCPFKTKWKSQIQKHVLTHGESPVTMFKCDLCEYEANRKGNLKRHIMRRHKTPMYKCDVCDYEAKQESDLKDHILTHKTDSEITIIKHELLDEPEEAYTSWT